jgi:NDP-sugar pyrophosphorylase family protein
MHAMILAAGRGTRLGPLGEATPKVLLEVGGEPLLARHLRYLADQGVEQVVVNVHHLAAQVTAFVARYAGPVAVTCIAEPDLLGTAGAVRNALHLLGSEPFVVLYGDILIDEPLQGLLAAYRRQHAVAALAVHAGASVEGKGVVQLAADGRVIAFVEKPAAAGADRTWINSGVFVLDPGFIAALPLGVELDFGHDVLPAAVARGERIFAHPLGAPVLDLGTADGLRRGRAQVAS